MLNFSKMWLRKLLLNLDNATDYFQNVQELLEDASRDFAMRITASTSGTSGAAPHEEDDWLAEEYGNLAKVFPEYLCRWHFVAVVALVEQGLVDLAVLLHKRLALATAFEDYRTRSQGIEKVREYLLNEGGMRLPAGKNAQTVGEYQVLRNCLIHAGGRISRLRSPKDRKKITSLARKTSGMLIIPSDPSLPLAVTPEVIDGFLVEAKAFVVEVQKVAATHLARADK